ncbi:MAG: hypothetical protein FJ035_08585 [Chloroflexi bacterium]|nr:hypothetical protein [Chloroflexota bacterium]
MVLAVALLVVRATGVANAAADGLLVTPATATNPVGTSHMVTIAYFEGGAGLNNWPVTIGVTGANAAAGACTTGASAPGECTFAYTGTLAGTDTIMATIATEDGPVTATATKHWTERVAPQVATTSSPTGGGAAAGTSASDTATVSGSAGTPSGTVTFFLCDSAAVLANGGDCAGRRCGDLGRDDRDGRGRHVLLARRVLG